MHHEFLLLKKTKGTNDLHNITHKLKDRLTQTQLKTGDKLLLNVSKESYLNDEHDLFQ
jgi:hypothetical protein